MIHIPTSMSSRYHPFLSVLQDAGVPYFGAAARANLPASALERLDQRISIPVACGFLDELEQREGIKDLAVRGANRDCFDNIEEPIRKRLSNSCTVFVCAARYTEAVRNYNGRHSGLRPQGDKVWIMAQTDARVARESWNRYSDWSNVILAIKVFRQALGSSWVPEDIAIQTDTPVSDVARALFPNTNITTGALTCGFTIPKYMMSWRMPQQALSGKSAISVKAPDKLEGLNLRRALSELITPYLDDRHFKIETLAEMACTSKRTLQRQLAEEGSSFRDILTHVRYDTAVQLLSDPTAKIIDVALELGFEDPSHFSRAFRRVAGQSPREYRRTHFIQ